VLAQQERGGHHGDQQARQLPPDGEYILWKEPGPAEKSAHPFGAEPEDEKTADHRGGNEEFAQRARPASNERCTSKYQSENDERQADLFHAGWRHTHLPGWTRSAAARSEPTRNAPAGVRRASLPADLCSNGNA
jgi:hypothetical protein